MSERRELMDTVVARIDQLITQTCGNRRGRIKSFSELTGVKPGTIAKWISRGNITRIDHDILQKICGATGTSPIFILFGKQPAQPDPEPMTNSHTPGPYTVTQKAEWAEIDAPSRDKIAMVGSTAADAYLFAAAPDIFKSCSDLLDVIKSIHPCNGCGNDGSAFLPSQRTNPGSHTVNLCIDACDTYKLLEAAEIKINKAKAAIAKAKGEHNG